MNKKVKLAVDKNNNIVLVDEYNNVIGCQADIKIESALDQDVFATVTFVILKEDNEIIKLK